METIPLTVHAYSAVDGAHIMRIPYTAASWSDSISDPGSMSVDITLTDATNKAALLSLGMYDTLRPWKTIISAQHTPEHVRHAGVITSRQWDPDTRKLTLNIGGGWTLLGKRLVLNHALATSFRDGEVLIDEDHPNADWTLTLTGSYRDICRGLIAETLKWGPLPITLPPIEGGNYTRTYGGYDLATIADRLNDLADIENGDEIRFTPHIDATGRLTFQLEAAPELIDHRWQWNATIPGQRVKLTGYDEDGATMTTDVWAAGGKNDDKTLMCRSIRTNTMNWPIMQTANTQHTTVSILNTLRGYAHMQMLQGLSTSETIGLTVGDEYDVHVGDHATVRVDDDLLGSRLLQLKITDVDGAADTDWLTLQARPLITEA